MTQATHCADDYSPGRVSVIIPCYNQARYLSACLDSVFRQAHADLEVIVVNDGSTDDTAATVQPYRNRLRYIEQDNGGLSHARNTGLQASSGEFIQFLDSDDLLAPLSITQRLQTLRKSGADMVACRNHLFARSDERGRVQRTGAWRIPHGRFDIHYCHFNIAPVHAFLLRRTVACRTGLFDRELRACEDYDYFLRAMMAGAKGAYSSAGLVYYRRHDQSMSADRSNQVQHDALMHARLAHRLLLERSYPQNAMNAKIMAFIAGLSLTLQRSQQLDAIDAAPLRELLQRANAALDARDIDHEASFEQGYYGLLALRRLYRLADARQSTVTACCATLHRHTLSLAPFASLFSIDRNVAVHDRLRLLRLYYDVRRDRAGIQ